MHCARCGCCAVCLRLQLDPLERGPGSLSRERCFADFAFSNCVLHLLVWNFMG